MILKLEYILEYSPVSQGDFRSRDAFWPIAPKQQLMMDYKHWYENK